MTRAASSHGPEGPQSLDRPGGLPPEPGCGSSPCAETRFELRAARGRGLGRRLIGEQAAPVRSAAGIPLGYTPCAPIRPRRLRRPGDGWSRPVIMYLMRIHQVQRRTPPQTVVAESVHRSVHGTKTCDGSGALAAHAGGSKPVGGPNDPSESARSIGRLPAQPSGTEAFATRGSEVEIRAREELSVPQ
jgi:hypothetical protein